MRTTKEFWEKEFGEKPQTKPEDELLPCPFCGGKVKLYKHLAQKGWGLSCSECYAMFFWEGTFDRYGNSKENIELLSKDRFNRRA